MHTIDWQYGAKHMWDRHGITEMEAHEAITDIDALWFEPDPRSRSGRSVKVIGYSRSRRQVLTTIVVPNRTGESY